MAKKRYTAAVIGTGRIGFTLGFDKRREQPASHVMALKKNKRFRLVSGCDKDSARLALFQRFNKKCAVYSNYSQMLASSRHDLIIIATNEDSHTECAVAAIKSKPFMIILEKPVSTSVSEAEKILEESEKNNIPVLVNHERRFSEDYKTAKKYLSKIGDILTVNARLDSGLYVYNPECESSGEYSLFHDGTHLVDAVMYFLEDETGEENVLTNMRISGVFHDSEKPEIVRNLTVHYSSRKCPDVNLFFSGRSRFFGFEIDIIGREGRIRIGNGIFEFYKRAESTMYSGFYSLVPDLSVKAPKKTKYFYNMIKNASDFLDGKAELLSNLKTGINTMKVLEEIKNQL